MSFAYTQTEKETTIGNMQREYFASSNNYESIYGVVDGDIEGEGNVANDR